MRCSTGHGVVGASGHRPNMCVACSGNLGGPLVGLGRSCGVSVCAILPRGG